MRDDEDPDNAKTLHGEHGFLSKQRRTLTTLIDGALAAI